ncbi:MAG: transposase [Alphaproteobacteria bacterium]|nr:transposase [Alphaproteobacteria bacterium]
MMVWAEKSHIRIQYIQLGKPQQNAYVELNNRTVRQEWLDQDLFATIRRSPATSHQMAIDLEQ